MSDNSVPHGAIDITEYRRRIDNSKVKCELCDHKAHSLVNHLSEVHKKTANQYRQEFPKALFVSPMVSELLRTVSRKPKKSNHFESFLQIFDKKNTEDLELKIKASLKPSAPELADLVPDPMDGFFFQEHEVKALCYGLSSGKNIYIEGPTGSGKTECILQIHAQAGLAIQRVNMNGDVTTANFIGQRQVNAKQGTFFEKGHLPKAMEGGYTLLIDEVDYMPPSIGAVLNSVLENKRSLYIPELDETIVAAEGFQIAATANTGGKGDMTGVYSGTEVLNSAFLDRFTLKLTMNYLPLKAEIEMLTTRFPSQAPIFIEKLVKAANEIRGAFLNGTIPLTISTRKILDILEMIPVLGQQEAMNLGVLNWADSDNREVLTQIFDRCGIKYAGK